MTILRRTALFGTLLLIAGACSDDPTDGDDAGPGDNQDPVAMDDLGNTTDENTVLTIAVLDNDSDPDQGGAFENLGIVSIDAPDVQGAVSIDVGGRAIVYDPTELLDSMDDGDEVVETFSYTVGDGDGGIASANVSVTVAGINDGPRVTEQTLTIQGGALITLRAEDPEDPSVTFSIVDPPQNGVLSEIFVVDEFTAEVVYTPDDGFAGTDSFTYLANDGRIDGDPAPITLEVGLEDLILVEGSYLINTDDGTIDGSPFPGFNGTTFNAGLVDIQPGTFLLIIGEQALDISSATDLNMHGRIFANGEPGSGGGSGCDNLFGGEGGAAGPGGFPGGRGGGAEPGSGDTDGLPGLGPGAGRAGITAGSTNGSAGGGGAGHAEAGRPGSTQFDATPIAGLGGFAYTLPLVGGSGGGGGSVEKDSAVPELQGGDDDGSGGGGGGGAVRFTAQGQMLVSGTIEVRGGDGGANDCAGGDGGGGSGGLVQLFAGVALPDITDSFFDIAGGRAGGPSGGDGADGRVEIGFTFAP